ncbi:hypothetical protein LINPERPRIM_LOCUS11509, partial [Linum perenne]
LCSKVWVLVFASCSSTCCRSYHQFSRMRLQETRLIEHAKKKITLEGPDRGVST